MCRLTIKVQLNAYFYCFYPILHQDWNDCTYGVALELQGEEALDYLNNRLECAMDRSLPPVLPREMTLGGYSQHITLFHPASSPDNSLPAPFPVLVFVASPHSGPYWLGPAEPEQIATQVILLLRYIFNTSSGGFLPRPLWPQCRVHPAAGRVDARCPARCLG